MAKAYHAPTAMLPTAPLLITESKDEFDRIRDALNDEIKPRGIIEQIYVADVSSLVWETLRMRRAKAAIVNSAFGAALTEIISQLIREPGKSKYHYGSRPDELARKFFSDPEVKKQIAGLLRQFGLDESAVEAEAIRKSADDLERINRLMASSEARRDKALVCIAQYRGDFGALLRESSNRIIGEKVPQLEHASSKQQKFAA
jgi:hypothetical protein